MVPLAPCNRSLPLMVENLTITNATQLVTIPGGLPWGMPRGEYHPVPLTLFLFLSFQGSGDYFLSSRGGFRVRGGDPSYNKWWKSRYFFISYGWGWGFDLRWSSRSINNSPLGLSNDEYEWLVKTRLSPAPGTWSRFFLLLVLLHWP